MLSTLFFSMCKIGAFTFGGGYAMLSLLQNEFCDKRKWLEQEEFIDLAAIAESTPGPIAINASTYIGYKMAGWKGAVAATVGMCLPSFVIILLISLIFDRFLQITAVANAFRGIQVCVVFLILSAGLKMLRSLPKKPFARIVLIAVFVAMLAISVLGWTFSSFFLILICAAAGLIYNGILRARKEEKP